MWKHANHHNSVLTFEQTKCVMFGNLFDTTCGNIDRNLFTVLLQMKERILYVEMVTVKRVMHYVWKHAFSYFN